MRKTLATTDGIELHLRHWPFATRSRGTVLIVHGLGEHVARYGHVAAHLNDWGWNVVGYDQRGHGHSGGAKGALNASDDLLRDLAQVIDATRAEHDGTLVLLGHSMGGLIAARFVAEGLAAAPAAWHRPVDALVLSSPALDPGMNAMQRLLLSVLAPLVPSLAVNNGLKTSWISRDSSVVKAYENDPLVHERVTPRLVRFIVDSGELACRNAARWTTPTLLMYAGSDRCVSPAGSARFAAAAPKEIVNVREFAPLYHEIFNEPEQAEVFAALGAWLAGRGH
ncbi:MAG: lysophospholipase [Betaproteobacteria bacterium]|nr:MAG: lysophospholipase [Betaproteobacteria bacterium]